MRHRLPSLLGAAPLPALLFLLLLLSDFPFLSGQAQAAQPAGGKPEARAEAPTHTNRLAKESSPYLLQHAHNPVDWYPWGDEAFEKARRENKPVFLSIGYATCHWCHVMERESFENEQTARLMNQLFVCVKVDREERPDIDRIYMNFQQAMYGHGGWPLSVWLTPDRIPFGSGTYFPPEPKNGMPSFTQVCLQIQGHWEKNGDRIRADPEGTRRQLQSLLSGLGGDGSPPDDSFAPSTALLDLAYERIADRFDPDPAGFATEPRFPQTDIIDFLLQYHLDPTRPADRREKALSMARATLEAMARGGIRDHLGGGFHRYAVDRYWHIPHFEKMLYDQAQIARAYLTLHQITGEEAPAAIAREIFDYLIRDLGHPDGPFYSAEDADSYASPEADHKTEGAFYTWTASEIEKVLGKDEAELFSKAYGIRPEGNARAGSDPHGELTGQNHLYQQTTTTGLTDFLGHPADQQTSGRLEASRARLLAARAKRIRPILDNKVLTAWNGLAISSLAHAYRALGDQAYLDRANQAADFLLANLRTPDGHLLRSYLNGPSSIPGTAIDYAALIAALIDLYEADFDPARLDQATALQDTMLDLLHDPGGGGFYDAPESQTDLIIRLKDLQDAALPSANSLAALNLMRLHLLLGRDGYLQAARGTFDLAAPILEAAPHAALRLTEALALDLQPPPQILLATPHLDSPEARALLVPAQRSPRSARVLALIPPDTFRGKLAAYTPRDNLPTLYLCQNFTCQAPTSNPAEIARLLADALRSAVQNNR